MEGWRLEGESDSTCVGEGTWSNLPPKCRRISCGHPKSPEYGGVVGDDYLYGGVRFLYSFGPIIQGI